jgi:hypothetical protein
MRLQAVPAQVFFVLVPQVPGTAEGIRYLVSHCGPYQSFGAGLLRTFQGFLDDQFSGLPEGRILSHDR